MKTRIRPIAETGSGRRTGWLKHVTSCDRTKSNGYAFEGSFLTSHKEIEIEVGAIIIRVDPEGSVKNGWKSGHVLQVQADGSLLELTADDIDWKDDFLTIRDVVCEALQQETDRFADFSDSDLIEECKKRGIQP